MKKLVLVLLLGILAVGTTSAFAWEGWGHGSEQNNSNGHGGNHWDGDGHNHHDNGNYNNPAPLEPLTSDEAKMKVESYIKEAGLKGYTIMDASKVAKGINIVEAKDASSNEMIFYVTPYGQVGGPVIK